ncbi:MAG TPA: PDZ domain-containing protein [Caldithrix sp.]|nr:PDZ domain-containing protein [Caldithrix sp.]
MKYILVTAVLFFTQQAAVAGNQSNLQEKILSARNKVMPALVHIEPVKSIFSTGERRHTVVTGSGFIFSPEGYILTNHHVVENAEKVKCTLSDKQKLSAKVIGSDPSTDVAVIQLNMDELQAKPLPYVQLGNSDSLEVGQIVLALGSPLGLSRSVSMGVISSIDRYFEDTGSMVSPYNLWIQTDAAINPGNSGGPLINLDGEVVGMNARGVFLAENLGFAIPINLAREIADKLVAGQKIHRSWIGVELQPVKEFREYLREDHLTGVLVSGLDLLSPARKAGLKAGDVITAINGRAVNAEFEEDLPAIRKIIADLPPEETVSLTVWRKGKFENLKIKTEKEPFRYLPEFDCQSWGLVVRSLTRHIFRIQNLPDYDGVYISGVKSGSPADLSGLKAGDVIREINNRPVKNLAGFKEYYSKLNEEKAAQIFVKVLRQGSTYFALVDAKKSKPNIPR